MKTNQQWKTWVPVVAITLAAITFLGWKGINKEDDQQQTEKRPDTVIAPKQKKYKYRNGNDYKLDELEIALKELNNLGPLLSTTIRDAMKEVDMELKAIDWKQINQEIHNAMKDVKLAETAMKEIDWNEINREISNAMKEAKVAEKAMKEINWKEINQEISNAMKEVNIAEKVMKEIDWKEINQEISNGMKEAKEGIEIARKEIADLKEFLNELDKDGLIDKDGAYQLKVKDEKLFIDGKEQSAEVNKKYNRFLKKGNYSISNDGKSERNIRI